MPNRLLMNYPKIGIRPIIDARRNDSYETLEKQTMRMARAAAKLITENLRYPDGSPVKVVIADTSIGGVAESALCQKKFNKEGVGITLSVAPCWGYGIETMDQDPLTIKGVWGFNGSERPGAVYLAAVLSAHNQKGLPAFGIYGQHVQDKDDDTIPVDVQEKLLRFARASIAVKCMQGNSYLQIGSVCMGIAGSIFNQDLLQEYFGMRSESVDQTEILRRIELGIYDTEEYGRAILWTKQYCPLGQDYNKPENRYSAAELDEQWKFSLKCMMIIRDLMIGNPRLAEMGFVEESLGHNAIACGVQGQRQWTDFKPNFDFAEAMLCSQFDWNGLREAFIVATENDILNGLTMLFEHLLTNRPIIFADVRTYWSPDAVKRVTGKELTGIANNGIIHLINSGAASLDGTGAIFENGKPVIKPFYEMSEADMTACLAATDWCPAKRNSFPGGGFSSHYKNGASGGMPVTMARLNFVKNLGPVLQLAEGYTCQLDKSIHKVLDERTNPRWPTIWFVPRRTGNGVFRSVYSVMSNWGSNHAALCYGHIGADLLTFASMLRIPVSMHNIKPEDIFRPSMWACFGTAQTESADFRACTKLGPLYK